jgi:hypothetical protein
VVSDTPRPVATTDNYWGVWGSGSDVWVVGDATIVHCRGSATCATESSGGSGALLGIWGSSASDVYAVGDGGRIVHYNGTAWSAMPSPTSRSIARVYGAGPRDIWAVGDSVVLHYDGAAWSVRKPDNELRSNYSHVPTPSERVISSGNAYSGIVGLGLWVRDSNQVYMGTGNYPIAGQTTGFFSTPTIERWNGYGWNSQLKLNSVFGSRRIIGLSSTTAGCALAVSDAQGDSRTYNLIRGVGVSGCFGSPMTAPSTWP